MYSLTVSVMHIFKGDKTFEKKKKQTKKNKKKKQMRSVKTDLFIIDYVYVNLYSLSTAGTTQISSIYSISIVA